MFPGIVLASGLLSAQVATLIRFMVTLLVQMNARPRNLNRSQTGPVPLECEKKWGRSVSANSGTRFGGVSSTGSSTPVMVTFVKPMKSPPSRPQSQSLDSGLVSLPSSSHTLPTCSSSAASSSSSGVVQVHEFIFLGTGDTVSNMQLICRNNIRYFVNVSANASNAIRSSQSCNCLDNGQHGSRSVVVMPYRDGMPVKELFDKFKAVNDIIRQARNKAQRVLIFSEEGLAACQAFALAYNVQYYNLDLDRALDNFERLNIKIEINDHLRNALIKWAAACEEQRVGDQMVTTTSRRIDWQEARPATVDCAAKRVAWQ